MALLKLELTSFLEIWFGFIFSTIARAFVGLWLWNNTHSICIESYKIKYKVNTYEIVRITDVTEDDRESPWRRMSSAMLTVSSWTWQWNERMLWRKLLVRGSHLTIRSHTILTRWSDILSSVFQSNSRPSGLEQFRCLHASSSLRNISASKVVTNDPNHNL